MEKYMFKYIQEVREYYRDFYSSNDLAHKLNHADEVCRNALFIVDKLQLPINKHLVVLASYIHDIFADDRVNHHIKAKNYVLTSTDDIYLNTLCSDSRSCIADAVYEHRSSYTGIRSSILSKVINAADIGPVNIETFIRRSYDYNVGKYEHDQIVKQVLEHMQDKFGTNGYREYSQTYLEAYGDIVKDFQESVDNLTIEQIEQLLSN